MQAHVDRLVGSLGLYFAHLGDEGVEATEFCGDSASHESGSVAEDEHNGHNVPFDRSHYSHCLCRDLQRSCLHLLPAYFFSCGPASARVGPKSTDVISYLARTFRCVSAVAAGNISSGVFDGGMERGWMFAPTTNGLE